MPASRARALAIIVASPDLIRVSCRTPPQMVLANALCRAWETRLPRPFTCPSGVYDLLDRSSLQPVALPASAETAGRHGDWQVIPSPVPA